MLYNVIKNKNRNEFLTPSSAICITSLGWKLTSIRFRSTIQCIVLKSETRVQWSSSHGQSATVYITWCSAFFTVTTMVQLPCYLLFKLIFIDGSISRFSKKDYRWKISWTHLFFFISLALYVRVGFLLHASKVIRWQSEANIYRLCVFC